MPAAAADSRHTRLPREHNEVCRTGVHVQRETSLSPTMLGAPSPVPMQNNPAGYLHRDFSLPSARGHHGNYSAIASMHMQAKPVHNFRRGHQPNSRNKDGHHAKILTDYPDHRHPIVPLQDRRALVCRSVDDIKRGPSPDYVPSKAPWRNVAPPSTHYRERNHRLSGALRQSQSDWDVGQSGMRDSPPQWDAMNTTMQSLNETTMNSRLSVNQSMRSHQARPMSPAEAGMSMDSLYKSGKPPPVVPPSKDNAHNSMCYDAETRPWRHSGWTGSMPSPAAPRVDWRASQKGVIKQKKKKVSKRDSLAAVVPPLKAGNPALSSILVETIAPADTTSLESDGGLRRFAVQQQLARKKRSRFPKLGVSATMLRKYLEDNAEALQGDELEHDAKVSKMFAHFDKDGDGLLNEKELLEYTAALKDEDEEWWTLWRAQAGIKRRYNKVTKSYYEDDCTPEHFAMLYVAPEEVVAGEDEAEAEAEAEGAAPAQRFRFEQLERDLGITLLSTAAVIDTLIKPETVADGSSFVELHRQGKDASGQRLIGLASIFVAHAGSYRFTTLCEAILAHLDKLQPPPDPDAPAPAEGEEEEAAPEEPLYVFIDAFSMNQHSKGLDDMNAAMVYANAIGSMKEMVLYLGDWTDPQPLTRAWCLWELLCAELQNVPINVKVTDSQRAEFVAAVLADFGAVRDKLLSLSPKIATAGTNGDAPAKYTMLHAAIKATVGYIQIEEILTSRLRTWLLDEARAGLDNLSTEELQESTLPVALAKQLSDMGEYDEALELFRGISAMLLKQHGDEDPRTLDAMSDVATCLIRQAQQISSAQYPDQPALAAAQKGILEAEKIAASVHEIQLVRVGKVDPATLTAAFNRAQILTDMYIFASQRAGVMGLAPLDTALFRNSRAPLEKIPLPGRWLCQAERLLNNYYEVISKWQRQGRGGDTAMREMSCLVQTAMSQYASGSNRLVDSEVMMKQALNLSRRSKDTPYVR